MTNAGKLTVVARGEREIVMTRSFDAPRDLVFAALTRPDLLRRWLTGPPGWTLEVCEIDLRVGGRYRYVWSHANGARMGMGGVYLEIVPGERLVNTERFDDPWYPGEGVATAVLVEAHSRTTLTTTILYESREAREAVLQSPMESGVEFGYAQLEAALAAMPAR